MRYGCNGSVIRHVSARVADGCTRLAFRHVDEDGFMGWERRDRHDQRGYEDDSRAILVLTISVMSVRQSLLS